MSANKHLAYGPDRHAVEAVMRLHAVKRWHMLDTTRQQTLAEHSANVALLALLVARDTPVHVFGDPFTVATLALVHDLEEAFTGDIPTHTKPYLTGLEILESLAMPDLFKVTPTEAQRRLIKVCDLADGIRFIRLHGVDITARHAREGLEVQLADRLDDIRNLDGESTVKKVREHIMFYAYEQS
jgi:5'-deoxynucleotidase YfbR-like HD superfamily hydrolase